MTARILTGTPPTVGNVPGYITPHITDKLPGSYRPQDFAEDLVEAFGNPPAAANRLGEILPEFRKGTIYQHEGQVRKGRMTTVKSDTADLYKFTRRFEHSPIRQQFLDLCNGDPVAAAEAFLNTVNDRAQDTSRQYGNKGSAEDGMSLGSELADMLSAEAGNALDMPGLKEAIEKIDGQSGGQAAGQGHNALIAKAFRLGEIVEKLKLQYEPYSHHREDKQETLFPDDVDFEPLRSLHVKDLGRIAYSEFNRGEDDFYYRLATKAMMQRVYFEAKPTPPRKFAMLLDVSSSMLSPLGKKSKYSRAEYATASAIALLQSAFAGGNEVSLVRFDDHGHPPVTGTAADIIADLLTGKFSAGGTNFDNALKFADELEVEELIMVTDGESPVHYTPRTSLVTYLTGERNPQLESKSRLSHIVEEV